MNFAKNPENDFTLPHWEEHFTRKELEVLLVQGYKQFYLKPSYILKKVIAIRSVKELVGLVRVGINFIRLKVESYNAW